MDLEPFSYYFMITKTVNLSHVKHKRAYLNQYSPIKYIKGPMGQRYPYFTRWEKHIVVIIYIYWALAIFLLFYDHLDTESESCEMEIVAA